MSLPSETIMTSMSLTCAWFETPAILLDTQHKENQIKLISSSFAEKRDGTVKEFLINTYAQLV
jgi:hypothetical protein